MPGASPPPAASLPMSPHEGLQLAFLLVAPELYYILSYENEEF